MKLSPQAAIFAAALMLGPATAAQGSAERGADELTGIGWAVDAERHSGLPRLTIRFDRSNSTVRLDPARRDLAQAGAVLGSARRGAVAFAIDRDPGILTCRGSLDQPYDGSGTCTFAARPGFEAGLRSRGIDPDKRGDLLAMALVDADLELIDGLARQGLAPRNANEVIGAAALEVTGRYVGGLRSAGLPLTSLADAFACRALGVDDAYVRGIAAAGYRPDVRQIVAMKATGVTPEYAQRMNAAARGQGETGQ